LIERGPDAGRELRRTAAFDQLDQGVQIHGSLARDRGGQGRSKAGPQKLDLSPAG
jgi:hypothetical protein